MKIKLKGFTLVEVIISCAIFAVVSLLIYSSFNAGLSGSRNIEENINLYQPVRKFFELINRDLRNSFAFSNNTTNFTGKENEVGFMTIVDSYYNDSKVPTYAFVSYNFENQVVSRLCRKNKESLNSQSEIAAKEVLSEVDSLGFEYGYYDNNETDFKWNNIWEEQKKLPSAVRVKLIVNPKVKKEFQRTIFLINNLNKNENK